jgi:hypothetical protein
VLNDEPSIRAGKISELYHAPCVVVKHVANQSQPSKSQAGRSSELFPGNVQESRRPVRTRNDGLSRTVSGVILKAEVFDLQASKLTAGKCQEPVLEAGLTIRRL